MFAEERQQAIATLVSQRGRLSVVELAETYEVTTETVRRDLSALERAGVVRRVHGGAVPITALSALEAAVAERDQAHTAEKDRIARAALELLPGPGSCILLDAGTTTGRLGTLISRDRRLMVVTNCVPIAARMASTPSVELHLLPGRVRHRTQAAVGESTVEALKLLRSEVAFIGTNGITSAHGFSTPDPSEAAVKRAMVAGSHKVVVLADSSKIGLEHAVRFAALSDVDVLVTDARAHPRDVAALEQHGLEVVVA